MRVIECCDYGSFQRLLLRSAEIAAEAGRKASVVDAFSATSQPAEEEDAPATVPEPAIQRAPPRVRTAPPDAAEPPPLTS